MLKHLFILLILCIGNISYAQSDAKAEFELSLEENNIFLDIKIEKQILDSAILQWYHQDVSDVLIEDYIRSTSKWFINDTELELLFCNIHTDQNYYYLETELSRCYDFYKSLTFFNTCLTELEDDHTNIVYVNYKGVRKGYRVNKDGPSGFVELER